MATLPLTRRALAAAALVLCVAWLALVVVRELERAWRTLPPRFERTAGTLRWHDREARRLRTFVAAARAVAAPADGPWCWSAPGVPASRRGEIFQWAAFLAPQHDLVLAEEPSPVACSFEVRYHGLGGTPAEVLSSSAPEWILLHRLGSVRVLLAP